MFMNTQILGNVVSGRGAGMNGGSSPQQHDKPLARRTRTPLRLAATRLTVNHPTLLPHLTLTRPLLIPGRISGCARRRLYIIPVPGGASMARMSHFYCVSLMVILRSSRVATLDCYRGCPPRAPQCPHLICVHLISGPNGRWPPTTGCNSVCVIVTAFTWQRGHGAWPSLSICRRSP